MPLNDYSLAARLCFQLCDHFYGLTQLSTSSPSETLSKERLVRALRD
jgi:hypothetical protein